MSLLDPSKHAVSGPRQLIEGKLQSGAERHTRITVPVVPLGDYLLQVEFTRLKGDDSVNLILPVGSGQVLLVQGGWPAQGTRSGLEHVDGKPRRDNRTTDRQFQIKNHRDYTVTVKATTRKARANIQVNLNAKPFIRWSGPETALTLHDKWALGNGAKLGLGSYDSVVKFRVPKLRMINGKARLLEMSGPMRGSDEPAKAAGASSEAKAAAKIREFGRNAYPKKGNIYRVDLGEKNITDKALRRLAPYLAGFSNLEQLDLWPNPTTDAGLANLSGLTRLKSLNLAGIRMNGSGLVHLKSLTRLEHLRLDNTNVGNTGLAHLKELPNLKYVDLQGAKVTDAGLKHLKDISLLEGVHLTGLNDY